MRWLKAKLTKDGVPGAALGVALRGRPRRRVTPLWRRRGALGAAAALGVGVLALGGWWLVNGGWVGRTADQAKWQVIATATSSGFKVREIFVEGRKETSRKRLLEVLRLERGAPILAFDLGSAKKRLEALPWVRTALVERRLPDVVYLRLTERRALALWQQDGRFALIDREGEVILREGLERFSHLLVVIGADAPAHAARLSDMLQAHPELARLVKAAVRVGGRRWNLHLKNDIRIRLPEADAAQAWSKLAKLEREEGLLERDITSVDLRLPDRVIVMPAETEEEAPPPSERDT